MMDNIIRYMRTEAPLLAPVFRSDGQARLLAVVLLGDEELSLTVIAQRAALAYPTAHREAARLLDAGILVERKVGRTRLLRANPSSPLTAPLRDILLVATGPVVLLAELLGAIGGIESAFLYGSYAARMRGVEGAAPQDIDVMVLGTPDADAVFRVCAHVEELVHRPVHATVLTAVEFAQASGFAQDVRSKPAIPVVGALPW